jgi:hypothetical protein
MSSDVAAIVGTTAALHLSRHRVKVVFPVSGRSGVAHFELDSRSEVRAYLDSRGSVHICGPIVGSFVGPASADVVIGASATVVPANPGAWPATLEQLAEDANAVNFSISALSPVPVATIPLSEVINHQLKPRPFSGRHPALLFGWEVETSSPTFKGRFEFQIPLEFSGVDWIKPPSWATTG